MNTLPVLTHGSLCCRRLRRLLGKQVWYRLRWVTKTGEKGPWGETAEATINK